MTEPIINWDKLFKKYKDLEVENEELKNKIDNAKAVCADQKARAKGQMSPERRCIELACNKISQALKESK